MHSVVDIYILIELATLVFITELYYIYVYNDFFK